MSLRGILTGSLALVALHAVTSSAEAADRVGGILGSVAGLVRWVIDPTVPGIPDLAGVGD